MPSVPIDGGSLGDNIVVPATAGKAIRVTSLCIVTSSLMGIRLTSGALGTGSGTTDVDETPLTGQMELAAQTPLVWPHNIDGWCNTDESAYLNIVGYRAGTFSGVLGYELIDTA